MENTIDNLNQQWLGSQLKAARNARSLTQGDVAAEMGFARTTLVSIEKGERKVTSRELVSFAKLYGRNLSEWLVEKPASPPLVGQFRLPSHRLELTEMEMERSVSELESLARDYRELEEMAGIKQIRRYPAEYSIDGRGMSAELRGEEVASQERNRLSLGDNPVFNLRGLLEDTVGLRIFCLDLPNVMGGIYAYNEELGGCIAINRRHPASRAKWSLAHEYGHFLSTRYAADVSLWNGEPWGKSYSERFADAFSKNFLMPRMGVNRGLSEMVSGNEKGVTVAHVLTLAHQFCVSVEAMFRRLEDLKRLPLGTWEKLKAQNFKADRAKQTLGLDDSGKEELLPFRYRMLLAEVYDAPDGDMTEAELAHYLRLDRVAARDELHRLRTLADRNGDEGFDSFGLDSSEVLVAL